MAPPTGTPVVQTVQFNITGSGNLPSYLSSVRGQLGNIIAGVSQFRAALAKPAPPMSLADHAQRAAGGWRMIGGGLAGASVAGQSLAGLANPWAAERNAKAWRDLGAVVGREFIPYLEISTRLVRGLADGIAGMNPILKTALAGFVVIGGGLAALAFTLKAGTYVYRTLAETAVSTSATLGGLIASIRGVGTASAIAAQQTAVNNAMGGGMGLTGTGAGLVAAGGVSQPGWFSRNFGAVGRGIGAVGRRLPLIGGLLIGADLATSAFSSSSNGISTGAAVGNPTMGSIGGYLDAIQLDAAKSTGSLIQALKENTEALKKRNDFMKGGGVSGELFGIKPANWGEEAQTAAISGITGSRRSTGGGR